ncbi:hypothetical protein HK100_003581 [Physocladia obscura]|uniref:Uncharacterized protein n=1 Tax=Physocladia obscura TaxID=109957 RepID=A0AAD5X9A5_9FUNG|nr:hypothetical protein HK100_003581 [Physocladia obscura]
MNMQIALLATPFLFATSTFAFTDGRLLPAYFCAAPNGALPYSLGGVLKRTVFNMDIPLAFNTNATANIINVPQGPTVNGVTTPDTAYMLASIHSTLNSIEPLQNTVQLTTTVALQAGVPLPLLISSGNVNNNVDGLLIFAELSTGQRVGTFTDKGGIFAAFPGCGNNTDGTPLGFVHTQLVSGNSTYSQLSFVPPATLKTGDVVAVHGLAVQDGGFGFHCTQWTVGGTAAATNCTVTGATGVVNFAGASTATTAAAATKATTAAAATAATTAAAATTATTAAAATAATTATAAVAVVVGVTTTTTTVAAATTTPVTTTAATVAKTIAATITAAKTTKSKTHKHDDDKH